MAVAVFGVPMIWQVTMPASVTVVDISPVGRAGLPAVTLQVVAPPPVLVKTMAGLIAVPVTAMTGVVMFASTGAMTTGGGSSTVIMTVAEDIPAILVAVIV